MKDEREQGPPRKAMTDKQLGMVASGLLAFGVVLWWGVIELSRFGKVGNFSMWFLGALGVFIAVCVLVFRIVWRRL